jgi:hypothetical protein
MHCLIPHITFLISYFQKFTDRLDLYLHHRNIYDSMIRPRIADCPLNLGTFVFLVLIASPPLAGNRLRWRLIKYFPPVEGHTRNYSALYFNQTWHPVLYNALLGEFLTDPIRAGKHVLDGSKYALVARFLLDCFLQPCPEQAFLQQVVSFGSHGINYHGNADIIDPVTFMIPTIG